MQAVGPKLRGLRSDARGALQERMRYVGRGRSTLVQAVLAGAAPAAAAQKKDTATSGLNEALLTPAQADLLQGLKGPVVKITAHYHVNFGDCLKVIGSSEEFGAWDAAAAPLMAWGEGDVWSLVKPLGPGEHEFKVVVQKGNGQLLWEGGDNRKVTVPEEAPACSMLLAECAFNYADQMPPPELLPLSDDVLLLLEQQAAEATAAETAAAAVQEEKQQVSQAAAAVAKALATMDAEAEGNGLRSTVASSDGSPSGTALSSSSEEDTVMTAAVGQSVGMSQQLAAAEAEIAADGEAAEAAAEEELEQQLEAMSSSQVHPYPMDGASSLVSKLVKDKPVAVGFMDLPVPAAAAAGSTDEAADSSSAEPVVPAANAAVPLHASSIVSSFMKRVEKPTAAEPAPVAVVAEEDAGSGSVVGVSAEASQELAAAEVADVESQDATAAMNDAVAANTPSTAAETALQGRPVPVVASGDQAQQVLDGEEQPQDIGDEGELAAAQPASSSAAKDVIAALAATAAAAAGHAVPMPPPTPSAAAAAVATGAALTAAALSSRGRSLAVAAGSRGTRAPSSGRGSSHVAAAAGAAAAMDWMDEGRINGVMVAAREAERAAAEKAAKLYAAQKAASAAAAESDRLMANLSRASRAAAGGSSNLLYGEGGAAAARRLAVYGGTLTTAAGAAAMPVPPDTVSSSFQGYGVSSSLLSAAANASAAAAAAAADLRPPTVTPAAVALAADPAAAAAMEGQAGVASDGMQLLSAMVGCAAVGTVLWSEFVLKDTGCGLPPGPYGLLGAAEGLSYLSVLGFAGTGLAARAGSGGKQGLPGALVVPEVLAYGALGAGLLVLASQLKEYGYIPPPLPGGQCYADAAVAGLPGSDNLSLQLTAQLAALQAILTQLKSAAADGIDQLQLQEQLAALQQQADAFSAYAATQTVALDASLHAGFQQLQTSLNEATTAVSAFVDTQLQQLDIPSKLTSVLQLLRQQEQQLVKELPRQFAELQHLAATATSMVQETALQAATTAHMPELLASLDSSMAVLHSVLENKIDQLDVMLTQLHDACAAAASQLGSVASAAAQAGSADAAAQLSHLQQLLSGAIASVQEQTWLGYQQLALADHLSDMLLKIRASATEFATSSAAEVDKLHLQDQLMQLQAITEASVSAVTATATDQLQQLELEQKLKDIEAQAVAAAASLQETLVQQYHDKLPVLEEQLTRLQVSVEELAAATQLALQKQQVGWAERAPELERMLRQLQTSMEATVRVVGQVASSSTDLASEQLKVTTASLGQLSGEVAGLAGQMQEVVQAIPVVPDSSAAVDFSTAYATALTDASAAAAPTVLESLSVAAPTAAIADVLDAAQAPLSAGSGVVDVAAPYNPANINLSTAPDAVKELWANRPQ